MQTVQTPVTPVPTPVAPVQTPVTPLQEPVAQGVQQSVRWADMGDDMEMDAEMGDMDMADDGDADISLTEEEAQLLIDLGSRLEAAMGDAGEEDMGDMDDEPMDDEPMDDEPMDDMGAEEEPEDDAMMQEDIVNEVLKRVTQRIIREKMKRK